MKLVSWLFDLQDQVAGRQSVGLKIWHINQKIWYVNTIVFQNNPLKQSKRAFDRRRKTVPSGPKKSFWKVRPDRRPQENTKKRVRSSTLYKTLQGFAQKKSALKNYYCGITRIYLPTNVQKNYLKSIKMNLVPSIYIFILISCHMQTDFLK